MFTSQDGSTFSGHHPGPDILLYEVFGPDTISNDATFNDPRVHAELRQLYELFSPDTTSSEFTSSSTGELPPVPAVLHFLYGLFSPDATSNNATYNNATSNDATFNDATSNDATSNNQWYAVQGHNKHFYSQFQIPGEEDRQDGKSPPVHAVLRLLAEKVWVL